MYDAGSISATLTARFEDLAFKRFDRAHADAERKAQKKIEAALGAKVDDRAFATYTQKLNEIERRTARKNAFHVALGADYDGRAFQAMERDLAKSSSSMRTTERDSNVLTRAFRSVAAGAGGAGDGMLKLRTDIGPLSGPLRAMAGVLAVLVPSMVAVAGAATALGASLAAAAAGAAAVSVGFAAAMGPIGGLMAALTSRVGMLGDAYKALDKEQTKGAAQATAVAETQRAAAERIESAQESLADSNRAVMRAQEDLTEARFKARREVQDLTDAVTHSAFAEERASLTLREVLQRLAETEADPTATRLQLDQARFAVREARHAVKDTAREHARANVDAKRGTDTVRDATEQLATARRQAARASDQVAAANAAAAVALGKQGAAATDAQQKMAELSRAERRLVRTFQNFSKSFRSTFQPATDAIFTGVNSALERLQPVMERFRGRFARLGDSIGGIIDRAAESLSGPAWTAALDSFIATAQRIVKPLSNAFGSVINIFRNIAVAAQPYVIEFADYLERALSRLEGKSRGEGLKSTIRSLVESTKDWWKFLLAVGDLLLTVFSGGKKEGDSLVESMTGVVKRWDAFLETDEGQSKMKEFFRDAVQMTKDLAKMLGWVVEAFVTVSRWVFKVQSAWGDFEMAMMHGSQTVTEWLRGAFVDAFDAILGGFTTVMGGISSISSAIGRITGIDKFKAIADEIDGARDSMDGFRTSLQEGNDELGRRQNIKLLQNDVKILKNRLGGLDEGTKEYRDTAEKLRGKQRQLNNAMADAKAAGDKGAKGPRAVGSSAANAANAVNTANASIVDSYNQLATQLSDLKPLKYRPSKAIADIAGRESNISSKPPVPGLRATGGWIGERGMVGEDTVPIIAAPGEAVLNRHQVPMVDEALQAAGYGGLDDLFARVQRPHYMAKGGIVPVPGFPGERANASIIPKIAGIVRRFPSLVLTDAFGPGHKSRTHTVTGTAADFAGPDRVMDNAVRYLVKQGYLVGYDGRFGSRDWPGHGPAAGQGGPNAHLHVELGGKGGAIGALLDQIKRIKINGPDGALKNIAQRAIDNVRGAGNRKLQAANAAMGALGAPHSTAEGRPGSNKQIRSWLYQGLKLAGVPPTPANINTLYGRVMQESGGNPRAINLWDSNAKAGYPSRGLLQTIPQTFNAYKVRGHNNIYNPVHNVAAAVRYMLARYGRLVGRSSTGYARGGRVGGKRPTAKRGGGGGGTQLSIRALRGKQTNRIGAYDDLLASVERDQKLYTQADRRYNLTDEELVDPETGFVNVEAVQQKASELEALIRIRERIEAKLRKARDIARRVVQAYKTIIKRFKASLRHAKKKDRSGIEAKITANESHLAEWRDKVSDTEFDVEDAKLDVLELGKERAEVLGTKADPRRGDEPDVPDTFDADRDRDTPESPEPVQLPPSLEDIMGRVMAEVRSFDEGRAELFKNFGSNYVRGGTDPFATVAGRAAGTRYFGGATSGSDGGVLAGGGGVTQNISLTIANERDAHTFTRAALFELQAAL